MNHSTPGLPVHHQLPESTQTHVHCAGDAIQPSHPLSSPSPLAFNLSQHLGLFKSVSSPHQVVKVLVRFGPLQKNGCSWGQSSRKETGERIHRTLAFHLLAWGAEIFKCVGLTYRDWGCTYHLGMQMHLWEPRKSCRLHSQENAHSITILGHQWTLLKFNHGPPNVHPGSDITASWGLRGGASSAEHSKNKQKQNKAQRKPYIMARLSTFLSASTSIILSKRLQGSFAECQAFSNIQLRRRAMSLLKPEHGWEIPKKVPLGRARSGLCGPVNPHNRKHTPWTTQVYFSISEDARVSPLTVKSLHISEDTSTHPQQTGPLSWADSS